VREGVVRYGRWCVLAAAGVWCGCSDGSGEPIDANGAQRVGVTQDEGSAPVGTVVAPLRLDPLKAPASGTTPDAIEITLSSNLDTVRVHSRIIDAEGAPLSDCAVGDVYRVGPSAVSWPMGGSISVPVAYGTALPDGAYVHAVSLGIGAFGNRWLQMNAPQYFGVSGAALQPLTVEAFQALAGAAGQMPPAFTADPCPELDDYSDEMTFDGATTSIDFDPWQQLGTIQPLRWVASATRSVGPLPSLLIFHALLADRGRLQLDLMTPADTPGDFDATFPEDGRILLDEVNDDGSLLASWRTVSGRVSVRTDEQRRLRIELADIVFARTRAATGAASAEAQRTVTSGLLVGDVIAEEWP
jgi:hypothetical protein